MDSVIGRSPKLPPTASAHSRRTLEAKGGVSRFYCDVCNIVFNNAQALGGHRGNSVEHKERLMKLQLQGGEVALLPPEGKGKPQWGLVHHPHDLSPSSSKRWSRPEKVVPAPFKIGRHVEVLYDDGVWYTGLLEKGPLLRNGVEKFMVSFDDGEEIWTPLPAKDVRPAVLGPQSSRDYPKATLEHMDLVDQTEEQGSFGFRGGNHGGKTAAADDGPSRTSADEMGESPVTASELDEDDQQQIRPKRKISMVKRYKPLRRKFTARFTAKRSLNGGTVRRTFMKPLLEAFNRYCTAERRRLKGDPDNPVMTDREAVACAVASWKVLSRAEKERWKSMSALPHAGLRADSIYYDVDFDVSESAKPFDKANEALASHQECSEGIEAIYVADTPDLMKFVADSPGLMKSDNSEEDRERDHFSDEITRGNPRRVTSDNFITCDEMWKRQCQCCKRRFNSKHSLHIHIGMTRRCKIAIWGPTGKLPLHTRPKTIAEAGWGGTMGKEGGEGETVGKRCVDGGSEMHSKRQRYGTRDIIASDDEIHLNHSRPFQTEASFAITQILSGISWGRNQRVTEHQQVTEHQSSSFHWPQKSPEKFFSTDPHFMHVSQNLKGERRSICEQEGESSLPQGPLRGYRARQALAPFFVLTGEHGLHDVA